MLAMLKVPGPCHAFGMTLSQHTAVFIKCQRGGLIVCSPLIHTAVHGSYRRVIHMPRDAGCKEKDQCVHILTCL